MVYLKKWSELRRINPRIRFFKKRSAVKAKLKKCHFIARRRRERMSEGKKNIIAGLIQEYDIKSAEDIQEALKDLLGGTIQEMMEAELDEHLGYDEYERSDNHDYRNGVKHKKLRSSYG